jgi:hypothetical protein
MKFGYNDRLADVLPTMVKPKGGGLSEGVMAGIVIGSFCFCGRFSCVKLYLKLKSSSLSKPTSTYRLKTLEMLRVWIYVKVKNPSHIFVNYFISHKHLLLNNIVNIYSE